MKKNLFLFSFLLFAGATLLGQTFVSTTPSNKNVILEEYTGVNCGYCPDGHKIANQIAAANPGRFWAINIHQGGYANTTPNYRTPFGDALANQIGLNPMSYPTGTVNRHVFSGSATALNRGLWTSSSNTILAQSSYVNVAAQSTIDFDTRVLTVVVEAYYTGNSSVSTNYLNVALLQNNILGPQSGAATNPTQMEGSQYRHMHMLRHLLTGQWGEAINTTTADYFYTNTFTYTVPEHLNNVEYSLEDLEVVVFITEGHQEIITGNESEMTLLNKKPRISELTEQASYSCDISSVYAKVKNLLSEDTITSLEFNYTINGAPNTFQWNSRPILPGVNDTVILPAFDMTSGAELHIEVELSKFNDIDLNPNSRSVTIQKARGGGWMTLYIATDAYASETTFKIFKEDGSVLLSGGPWPNLGAVGTTLRSFAIKPPVIGCYKLEVYDSFGDGINSGAGNGYVKIIDNIGNQIYYNNGKFSSKLVAHLYADAPSLVEENEGEFSIYPNPVDNLLKITSSDNIRSVELFNIQGQLVLKEGNVNEINVSNLTNGIYMMRVTTDNGVKVQKIVKE